MDISITELMHSYGAWVNDDGDNMGCKSPAYQLMRVAPKQCKDMIKPKSKSRPAYISDDLGLQIDRAMKSLSNYSMLLYDVVNRKFVKGQSDSEIARIYNSKPDGLFGDKRITRHDIKSLITEGLGNLNGMLIVIMTNSA